jgi:hypothetical protein
LLILVGLVTVAVSAITWLWFNSYFTADAAIVA